MAKVLVNMRYDKDLGTRPDKVIAARYGISRVAVWKFRKRYGIQDYHQHKRELIRADNKGGTVAEVAARHGVSVNTVKRARARDD